MKAIWMLLVVAGVWVTLSPMTALGTPWRAYFWGTGHYYEVSDLGTGWEDAQMLAESASYLGAQGHLATIGSAEENDFIANLLEPDKSYWLGGSQSSGGEEPTGGWGWATGEAWGYENWAGGAPDNTAAETWRHPFSAAWPTADWVTLGPHLGYDNDRFVVTFGSNGPDYVLDLDWSGQEGNKTMQWVIDELNDAAGAVIGPGVTVARSYYLAPDGSYRLEIASPFPGEDNHVSFGGNVWKLQETLFRLEFAGGANEDYLAIYGSTGMWNDAAPVSYGFVVEYPVPEPGTLLLMGLWSLAVFRRVPRKCGIWGGMNTVTRRSLSDS